MSSILIVGYGNIGRHTYRELEALKPHIYDPYVETYNTKVPIKYDYAFVCVPTEKLPDGSCDTSVVEQAVAETDADIIVIKSAIPVGTTDFLADKYNKSLVISPEYYGTTQHSLESPNFLILGGKKEHCQKVAQLFYQIKNGAFKIKFTDRKAAELAKYMENCFLALKVSFCCEFFDIARQFGVCYEELREIFIMDDRMGCSHTFVHEDSPYYNSHCLNKDIPALIRFAKAKGAEAPLMAAMEQINNDRKIKINLKGE